MTTEIRIQFSSIKEAHDFLRVACLEHTDISKINLENAPGLHRKSPPSNAIDGLLDKTDDKGNTLAMHHQPWHSTEDEFIINNYEKLTAREMVKHLQRTRETIATRFLILRKMGKLGYKYKKLKKNAFQPNNTIHISSDGIHYNNLKDML